MNLDTMAVRLFGQTKDDAWTKGECIRCRLPVLPHLLVPVDRKEYFLTAFCPACWKAVMPPDEPIQ